MDSVTDTPSCLGKQLKKMLSLLTVSTPGGSAGKAQFSATSWRMPEITQIGKNMHIATIVPTSVSLTELS